VRRLLASFAAIVSLAVSIGIPQASATDLTGIGYLDQTQLNAAPEFRDAQSKLIAYKQQLDSDFANQVRGVKGEDAQRALANQFSERFAGKQHELVDPLIARAQAAIAAVARTLNLSVVVDRRIIIVGGLDVTGEVIAQFHLATPESSNGAVSPPQVIGYVDQRSVDQIPGVKSANDKYLAFQRQQRAEVQKALASVRSDADRNAILTRAKAADERRQRETIDPIVARTREAMATVAGRRSLALIVDKAAILYGGTDVTADVQTAVR
jgi:outer membrane protein